MWGAQTFYRALSLVNGGREIECDLFAGIPDEGDIEFLFDEEEAMAGVLTTPLFANNGTAFNQHMY